MDSDEKSKEIEQAPENNSANTEEAPIETNIVEPESVEEESETGEGLLTGAKYEVPTDAGAFVDTKDGKVIKREDLTPFQLIKAIADQNGYKIKNPDKSCRHCYGRGYEALDSKTQMPILCRCLFRGRTLEEKRSDELKDSKQILVTRAQRRKIAKSLLKQIRSKKNESKKESDNDYIDKILKQYIQLKSLKQTAKKMSLTLTEIKKVIKSNREKIEKLRVDK